MQNKSLWVYLHLIFGIGFVVLHFGKIEAMHSVYKDMGVGLPFLTVMLLRLGDISFSMIVLLLSTIPLFIHILSKPSKGQSIAIALCTLAMIIFISVSRLALTLPLEKLIQDMK